MSGPAPSRYICIHGHFYQPPRENPWLEAIEVQDSAAPYHDWNERVTAECYAPNAVARVLDHDGYVVALRNNYRDISFNFGPTLLSWMETARPDVYASIQAADRASQTRFGHGNAVAQAYGHCIMPLASRRDQLTQVRWGVADFVHRFGRPPEGMWLPETAADLASLRALAENGIRYTILAPSQAARVRHADGAWQEVHAGSLDTTRPYRCELGGGKSIVLFFYDGDIAHSVAFAGLLNDGREFARRLSAAAQQRAPGSLTHFATDGESYGHHHRFGEMALAVALDELERQGEVKLTNYAAYLERVRVVDSVEIHENSSWSCAHGVERWRAHCGCNAGRSDWQQAWRAPLREALDWLKLRLDELFEQEGAAWFHDPWAARDAYVQVILRRDRDHRNTFLHQQVRRSLHGRERSVVWKLLELQRYGMLSFTSCGWFFDEPSGLETTQILTYAARAIQLAAQLGGLFREEFLRRLTPLRSNLPQYADGADLYDKLVGPSVSDGRRVVAHYAMNSLFEAPPAETHSYMYRISASEHLTEHGGAVTLALGRARVVADVTEDSGEYEYAALHLGGQDMQCSVVPVHGADAAIDRRQLLETFRTAPLTELIRKIDEQYADGLFTLRDVFVAERRRILQRVTGDALAAATTAYEEIVGQNRRLIEFLVHGGAPIPQELLVAAGFVLQKRFDQASERLVDGRGAVAEVVAVAADAQRWGIGVDRGAAARRLELAVADSVAHLGREETGAVLERCHALLDAAAALGLSLDVAEAQNVYYRLWLSRRAAGLMSDPDMRRLGERLHFRLSAGTGGDAHAA